MSMHQDHHQIRQRAVQSSIWTLCGYGSSQALRLGSHLILAWWLAPSVFGLMALVKVFMQGLNMFSDVGIRPSIIQSQRGDDPDFLNTAWTIQVIRGILLWLTACALAWPVSLWFARSDPAANQLLVLLPVAGLVAVFQGFESTAMATLNRHLNLGRMTVLQLVTQLVSLTVMIAWAMISPTVWSMVAGGLAGAAFRTWASHVWLPGSRPSLTWHSDCAAELFRFGRWIFLSTLFTFLAANLDKLILGRLLTLDELGLYSIAFVFARFPLHVCAQLSARVLFPVFTTCRDDIEQMVQTAYQARALILSIGLAVLLAFAISARLFFETLWDDRYLGVAPVARLLCVYIWAMILLLTIDRIPLARGNSRIVFFSSCIQCAGITLALVGYTVAQMPGFIVGMAAGPCLSQLVILRSISGQLWRLLWQGVRFTGIGTAYGITAVFVTDQMYTPHFNASATTAVILLAALPVCVAAFFVYTRIGRRQFLPRKLRLVVERTIA